MDALDRIKRAHVAIMRHPKACAFSGVLATGRVAINNGIPTARTDGWNVEYAEHFIATLSDPQLRLLILHECLHKSFRHLRVWRDLWRENPHLTNIAADHFVNLSLVDLDGGEGFLQMPEVGVQPDARYRGWSVRQIYDDLKRQQQEGGGDNPDNPDEGGGFDQHDWQASEEMTEADAQARAKEIDRALRQGEMIARKRGQGKGASSMLVEGLLATTQNWRELLRDFIQQTCAGRDEATWAKVNRRFVGEDTYLPSMQATTMGELVVAIDTSGSCFMGTVIKRFVSELATIIDQVRPSKVRVVYCDSDIRGEQVFEDGQFALASVKVRGGGGTALTRVFDWVRAKCPTAEAVVVFTDGRTPYGSAPPMPVLWAMTTGVKAPYGTTIQIQS